MSSPRTAAWDQFPPHVLREYALVADGRRGALIGPRGDVVWLCAPRWHDDAVLASLIGGEGVYSITPAQPSVWSGSYEPGSLIWGSQWTTPQTMIGCREALAQPGDPHRVVLLRRIEAGDQDAAVRVRLTLGRRFGRGDLSDVQRGDDGTWTATLDDLYVRWSGCPEATAEPAGGWSATVVVPAGTSRDLVLEVSERQLPARLDADAAWTITRQWWEHAVPNLDHTVAPRDSQHAYAVLQGLTDPEGGMVAAATLGLPEQARGRRNYDYRYVWVRDQAYAGLACAVGEPLPLMDLAVHRVSSLVLEHGEHLPPAVTVTGGDVPQERELDLPGYPGGRDVVGNWVRGQFQLDVFGEVLQLLCAAAQHGRLDTDGVRALELAAQVIERRWTEPEAGIWELDDAWWTQSRLSCVAGLRAASNVSYLTSSQQAHWSGLADTILRTTSERCLAPDGSWRRSPDHDGVDAALLLAPVRGALAADDPRTVATLRRVTADLTQDGYVYRFRHGDEPLGQSEGAFSLCGFTMALAQAHAGHQVEALRWFERARTTCGPPGLLTEEIDVRSRQLRGNLPQAFVHAMLLETAQRLSPAGSLGAP